MKLSPIRVFGFRALLWLPLCFFLWFWFASPLVWPVAQITRAMLLGAWPQLFADVALQGHLLDVVTRVVTSQVAANGQAGIGQLVLNPNPMIYGYSLPLFAGLAMATPISTRRRTVQFAIALSAIWLAQSCGVVAESLKLLAFSSGEPGIAAISAHGLSVSTIALAYQFGYLILPAVVPMVLWIALNRDFIGTLVRRDGEPGIGSRGPSPDPNAGETLSSSPERPI